MVRAARRDDLSAVREFERAAGAAFRDLDMAAVADDDRCPSLSWPPSRRTVRPGSSPMTRIGPWPVSFSMWSMETPMSSRFPCIPTTLGRALEDAPGHRCYRGPTARRCYPDADHRRQRRVERALTTGDLVSRSYLKIRSPRGFAASATASKLAVSPGGPAVT